MKRIGAVFLSVALAAALACCLSGCEFLGFKYVGYPEEEQGRQQIEIDRPYAESCMRAYLGEKYGLSDGDYSINDLLPWTLGSRTYFQTPDRPYYMGTWQARIDAGSESFYASVAVSGDELSCDSRQADEYYPRMEAWVREALQLPEACKVSIDIDTDRAGTIIQADRNPIETVVRLFSGYEHYMTLVGYYDGEDLFSPIRGELRIYVYYPEGCTGEDYASEAELSEVFPEDVTGDITVAVRLKAPDTAPQDWARLSSADLADDVGDEGVPAR